MAESKIEYLLPDLLARVNASDPAVRNVIYEKLRAAVRRHPANVDDMAYARSSSSLERAIAQTEARYAGNISPPAGRKATAARASPRSAEVTDRAGGWLIVLAALFVLVGPALDFVTPMTSTFFGLSAMTIYCAIGFVASILLWLLAKTRILSRYASNMRGAAALAAVMVLLSGVPVIGGAFDGEIRARGAIAALLPGTRDAQDKLIAQIATDRDVAGTAKPVETAATPEQEKVATPEKTVAAMPEKTPAATPVPEETTMTPEETTVASPEAAGDDPESELARLGIPRPMWPDAFARSVADGDLVTLDRLVRAGYVPERTGLVDVFARAKWSPQMQSSLGPVSKQVGDAVCDPSIGDSTRAPLLASLGVEGIRYLCAPHRALFASALVAFSESYRKEQAALDLVTERRRQCSVDVGDRISASEPLPDYFPEAEFDAPGSPQKSREALYAALEDPQAFHEFTRAEIDAMSDAEAYCSARVPKTFSALREKAKMDYAGRVLAMIDG